MFVFYLFSYEEELHLYTRRLKRGEVQVLKLWNKFLIMQSQCTLIPIVQLACKDEWRNPRRRLTI